MTMIFLYALPMLSGFSNYLWPLLLGSRDMAFPRLNAFSYWIYPGVRASSCMWASSSAQAPNDGWFNYVPLRRRGRYNPGMNIDFYALGMIFLGISTTVGAANFIVTLLAHPRARHVDQPPADPDLGHADRLGRPICSAVPAVSLAFFLLWMDRQFGTHFFDVRQRRPAAAVAAPVLDVRPSLGLRDRAAGDGDGLGRVCRCSAAGRWSATRWSRSRRWRR